MPRLFLASDFTATYAKLEKPVRAAVDKAISLFSEHTHAGLHLEKLANPKDPRIRTIRITDFWRGVVLAQGDADYVLLTVMPHDKANAFAVSRKFTVNQVLGVLEVRDQTALDSIAPALSQVADTASARLFDTVGDHDLARLGIDAEVLPIVRLLTSEDHLTALGNLLPEPQFYALVALATNDMDADRAWQDVCAYLPSEQPPDQVDTEDLPAAIGRTSDRYVEVTGPAELADILAHPFAMWRTFLHPRQRRVAYHPSHRGPVLVSGGAGTGKTVTVLHRAAYLAKRLPPGDGADVLITTFNRGLANAIAEQLPLLIDDPAVRARIDVLNVDKLANQLVTAAEGHHPAIATSQEYSRLWQSASGGGFSARFLQDEWEQVILAQDLPDREAYLGCERPGRGKPIRTGGAVREQIWSAIAQVTDELRKSGKRSHLQVAQAAADVLAHRAASPYRHVLVDEGQDLHPAQWRLLRRAVARGADDLFIVSDPNQRIYPHRVSLASLGITVRGRSTRLTVSYRTTQEILAWSVRMLAGHPADGLDDQADTLSGYHSPVHGGRPSVRAFGNRQAELDGIVELVRGWLAAGVEPHAIGVTARTSAKVKDIRAALQDVGVEVGPAAVRLDTMHLMKGMEFRCVLVAGVDADTVPATPAVTPLDDDPVAHAQDLHRERCLLFVACTRARDLLVVTHAGAPSPFLGSC